MSSAFHVLSTTGLGLLLVGNLLAQQPEFERAPDLVPGTADQAPPIAAASAAIHRAFGVTERADGPLAAGPDYEAEFTGGAMTFVPAMPSAPTRMPLTLRTIGFGRGVADRAPSAAAVTTEGTTVYLRRAEFVESYRAQQRGIKQDFVFDRLPAGAGDLVVRLAVETDLTAAPAVGADGALRFDAGEHGGVTIGKVVGVDANGARAAGSMSYEAGTLELRLPQSFVDSAALPLVLDPFIGTTFAPSSGWDDSDMDVAYDATEDVYLVTWSRLFSLGSNGIRAIRVAPTGATVGGLISIESSTFNAYGPKVANINVENAFLVVYAQSGNIVGRAVRASDGIVTATTATILDNANTLASPDVGGEATTVDDEAIVVWDDITADEIQCKQVNVNGLVSPPTVAPFAAVVVVGVDSGTSWSNSAPAISKSGGSTGVHCITWSRDFSGSVNTNVRAALVNRNLTILDALLAVTLSADGDSDLPNVDGDGRNWVVAWENEATPASGDNDVQARSIGWDPAASVGLQGFLQSGIVDIENGLGDDERVAQVAWVGDSAVVMYEDETLTAGDYDVYVQPVDLFTAADCGLRLLAGSSGGDQGPIRAASKASGGASDDQALIVWSTRDLSTGDDDLSAIRFAAEDGVNTTIGGGCGVAGVNYAGCAMVGNTGFRVRLRSAASLQTAFWVLSPSRLDFPCGSCTLVPDPFSGFVVSTATDNHGDASLAIAIPNSPALSGAEFYHQWLIANATTPACTSFGSDLSDALRTRIQ